MKRYPGKFIVLEGLDGAGTTTQLRQLHESLTHHSIPHVTTAQPSQGPIGQLIRQGLRGTLAPLSPRAMMLLFAADRHHHLDGHILPQLQQGIHVLCDRYVLSSLAYQQAAGVSREAILEANDGVYEPDLYLYVRVDPDVAKERRKQRNASPEAYETAVFQERVATLYTQESHHLQAQGVPLVTINGNGKPEEVHALLLQTLQESFGWKF